MLVIQLKLLLVHIGVSLTELQVPLVSVLLSVIDIMLLLFKAQLVLVITRIMDPFVAVFDFLRLRRAVLSCVVIDVMMGQILVNVRPVATFEAELLPVLLVFQDLLSVPILLLLLPLALFLVAVALEGILVDFTLGITLFIQMSPLGVSTQSVALDLSLVIHLPHLVGGLLSKIDIIIVIATMTATMHWLIKLMRDG